MQIYEKPKAKWNELAHQHRKGLFQTYWGSPIIKLGEHQYIEVLYVEPSDRPDLLYAIRPQGVIVLCDANSVVTNVTIIKKIMELSLVLASYGAKPFLEQVEFFASVTERDAQKKISAPEWTMWFKNQERVLCNYVSANGLKTFLCLLEEKQRALAQRALEANKMLRVLNAILDGEIVPAEHIQALEQLDMRAKHWNIRNTQILIEMNEYTGN